MAWVFHLTLGVSVFALLGKCTELPQASINYTLPNTRPVLKLESHGGQGSIRFDDTENNITGASILKINSIDVGSLYQVDYIQVTYLLCNGSLYKAPIHGDGIFTPETITLGEDEFVEKIEGKTNGEYVNQLTITTYSPKAGESNVYGPYGTTKLNATQSYAFEGNIVGFYGTIGKYTLSSIGAYSLAPAKTSDYYGTLNAASNFSDNPDATFPPVVRISKLFVRHGIRINAIRAEYQLFGGGTRKGAWHGGWGGKLSVLDFAPDEHIIGFRGFTESAPLETLSQLTFTTIDKKGKVKFYGPYGKVAANPFSRHVSVIGFKGSASITAVKGIQFFYYEDIIPPNIFGRYS